MQMYPEEDYSTVVETLAIDVKIRVGIEETKNREFRCYEAKIEESEKAGSRRESNPGHLPRAASALPLSYDNRTITSPHNSLCVLHRWD